MAGGMLGTAVAAWGVDSVLHAGKSMRNVRLAGVAVGGLSESQVEARVHRIAAILETQQFVLRANGKELTASLQQLGADIDVDATVEAVMASGREGLLSSRVGGWVTGLANSSDVDLDVRFDRDDIVPALDQLEDEKATDPIEPTFAVNDGELEVVEGKPGRGLDPGEAEETLENKLRVTRRLIIPLESGDVEPAYTKEDAEALLAEAERWASQSLEVKVGESLATVPKHDLRNWVTTETTVEGLRVGLSQKELISDLADLAPDAADKPVDAKFEIRSGKVIVIPSEPGTKCCDPFAEDVLEGALRARATEPAVLPLATLEPSLTTEEARALGVVEPIGTFTTRHRGGEPRVQNIHRIADLLKGHVILPGETFSVNKTVGPRTRAKGFVSAPVIEDGKFSEGVGGGVSQYATTLFNAAFYAGLDIPVYQSHSIYISRYPRGIEATLSHPAPDLHIRNNTPYGVVIWAGYTETSITVTLYSTRYVEGSIAAQSDSARGVCTVVHTTRARKYVDGRTDTDRFRATYRPAEGVNCT